MKKKIFLLLTFTIIMLAGCIKSETIINLNEDGSASVSMTIGVAKDTSEMEGFTTNFDEVKIQLVDEGFEVGDVEDDEYVGLTATKLFRSVDDIVFPGEDGLSKPFTLKSVEGSDKKRFEIDLTDEFDLDGDDELGLDISMVKNMFDIKIKLSVPGTVEDHNATTFEKDVLTWDIFKVEEKTAFAEFSGKSKSKFDLGAPFNFDNSGSAFYKVLLFTIPLLIGIFLGFILNKRMF